MEQVNKAIVNTAKMKIDLKNLDGTVPEKHDRWGWFSGDLYFDGEKIGKVSHNHQKTDIKCKNKKELREFADKFPDVPPHGLRTDAETIIRMVAFDKLKENE